MVGVFVLGFFRSILKIRLSYMMSIDHFIDRKASHINSLSIHQLPEVVGGGRLKCLASLVAKQKFACDHSPRFHILLPLWKVLQLFIYKTEAMHLDVNRAALHWEVKYSSIIVYFCTNFTNFDKADKNDIMSNKEWHLFYYWILNEADELTYCHALSQERFKRINLFLAFSAIDVKWNLCLGKSML